MPNLIHSAYDVDLDEFALYLHALARGIESGDVLVSRVADLHDADTDEAFRRTVGIQFNLKQDADSALYNSPIQLVGDDESSRASERRSFPASESSDDSERSTACSESVSQTHEEDI